MVLNLCQFSFNGVFGGKHPTIGYNKSKNQKGDVLELVYLWVEDYKNIQKQGFNFSPRFNCHYDEDKNELTIDENDDYIENFFGDNINVTAIVGKNGSGKSNILEALICIMEEHGVPWDYYEICAVFYDKNENSFYTKDINFKIMITNNKINSLVDLINHRNKEIATFLFHYDYTLNYIDNKENNINFNELYYKNDSYTSPVLLQLNKANRKIDNWLMDYLASKDMLTFLINKNISINNIEKFFIPHVCKLDFSFSNLYKNKTGAVYDSLLEKYKEEDIKYLTDLSRLNKNDLIYLTILYIRRKSREKDFNSIKDLEFQKLLHKKSSNKIDKIIKYIADKKVEDLYYLEVSHKVKKIQDSLLFIEYLNLQSEDYRIESEVSIDNSKELLRHLAPWIDIEFFDINGRSFNSLSYGQKFLIKFLYSLLSQFNNLESYDKYQNIIVCLDEVELGLHPQWQKEYISLLIEVLRQYSDKYQFTIICSTHSPFILSDFPKENVIFLKNGLKEKGIRSKQTFGANIHTLLSDTFFMEDGLMGEFAKGKINEIINFHKLVEKKRHYGCLKKIYVNSKKQRFWDIQKIIGEDYLKQVIQNHLVEIEKELLGSYEAKKEEIKRVEAYLESLKK